MYAAGNPRTKKAFLEQVKSGTATLFEPGFFPAQTDGLVSVEGPHYPEPHRWWSTVEIKDGKIVRVVS